MKDSVTETLTCILISNSQSIYLNEIKLFNAKLPQALEKYTCSAVLIAFPVLIFNVHLGTTAGN